MPLLLFAGAVGKSAQVPLQVWLPDAMEGPTPVSALIHAATMVAAGVYLVARTFPLFAASEAALTVVAWIGAASALLGATVAVTQQDIKQVLAYSTISQLGFMMAALGSGSPDAGIFHLFTHAWFKALLFLGAGSVIHATGSPAGRRARPAWPGACRLPPGPSSSGRSRWPGIPPFAGFWSKDEIFAVLAGAQPVIFVLLLAATFLTGFYIFRVVLLVFFGELRVGEASAGPADGAPGGGSPEPGGRLHGVHESGPAMTIPLALLALAAMAAGFVGAPFLEQPLQGFLDLPAGAGPETHAGPWVSVVAGVVALAGVALAFVAYRGAEPRLAFDGRLRRGLGPVYRLAARGWGFDQLYGLIVIRPYHRLAGFLAGPVEGGIDRAFTALGSMWVVLGGRARRLQSGEVRDYLATFAIGAVIVAFILWGAL